MENKGLVVVFEVTRNCGEEGITKIAVFREFGLVFEVDKVDFRGSGGGFGLFG